MLFQSLKSLVNTIYQGVGVKKIYFFIIFFQQVALLSKVQHPHIIDFYGYSEKNNHVRSYNPE